MKELEILKRITNNGSATVIEIKESIKELEYLKSDLIDLFNCIELTEDENAEKRLSAMETYLRRLCKFKD